MKTKLEKSQVQSLLLHFDIVRINEVKTSLVVSFPGYVSFRSAGKGSSHRGGTVVFIRNSLASLVTSVDTSIDDQVWLTFRFSQKLLFGFCYVHPSDSRYYLDASFASIQEKTENCFAG